MNEKDRRQQIVILTKSGEKLYQAAMPVVEKCFKEMQSGLTASEIEQTKKILSQMQLNVDRELKKLTK